jgi:hypothetical protein
VLALAAEGTAEEDGAIQHNLPVILEPGFACAIDGAPAIPRMKKAGPVVVSLSHELPYAPGTFDEIVVRNAPVCSGCGEGTYCEMPPSNYFGTVFCMARLMSLLKDGGVLNVGPECFVSRGENNKIKYQDYLEYDG